MPAAATSPPHSWLARALAQTWAGARPSRIVELKGDASSRRFWRVFIDAAAGGAPPAAIAVDLGPNDLPLYAKALKLLPEPLAEPPWLNVHRFLTSIGVAVPKLYSAAPVERLLLVEDLGDLALFEAAAANPTEAGRLYRAAVDELLLFHVDGTARPDPRCVAFSVAYDQRLFGWEMEQFVEFGIPAVAPKADRAAVAAELAALAERLGQLPRVLSHRDYHGWNLFVQAGPTVGVLDFQDALLAPAAQDLAVLLTTRDTASVITPALEAELLAHYLEGRKQRGSAEPDSTGFYKSYRLCVLQHALKAIGRFVQLERAGKRGYGVYLPHLLGQARRMLASIKDFPDLGEALDVK